jgi:hypothetical protein
MNSPLAGAALSACLAAFAATGCGLHGGRFTMVEENDVFNVADPHDTDRDYTQGAAAAFTFTDEDTPEWARQTAGAIPLFAKGAPVHLGLVAGQEIYTPEQRYATAAIPGDRPYAAWLYGGLAIQVPVLDADPIRRRDRLDQAELDLGVIGPSAEGEPVQNLWHRAFGLPETRGWRHQVGGAPGAMAAWETRWRLEAGDLGGDVRWDLLPKVKARLGNVHTDATLGIMARIGWRQPRDFGPMAVDSHGLVRGAAPDGAFLSFHVALEARAVAYDRFLSGSGDSPSVTPARFPGAATVGLEHGWGPFTFVFEQHFVAPEFRERRRSHQYTTMMLILDWDF